MADMQNMKMPEGGIVPRRDLKPLADEVQSILEEAGITGVGSPVEGAPGAAAPKAPEGGPRASMTAGEAGREIEESPADVSIIAETLGVSMEKAQALYDAAMMMPKFEGKSPAEVADMLEKDMNLRMQLEKNMGASEDSMARKAMAAEGMKAPAAAPPPMEPTPAGAKK
jgi:hypothetical protein